MEKMFVFPNVEVDQILIHKIYDELCLVYIYNRKFRDTKQQ